MRGTNRWKDIHKSDIVLFCPTLPGLSKSDAIPNQPLGALGKQTLLVSFSTQVLLLNFLAQTV